jgi:hypothetical protein
MYSLPVRMRHGWNTFSIEMLSLTLTPTDNSQRQGNPEHDFEQLGHGVFVY